MRNFLMQAMEFVTKHPRYRPEFEEIDKKTRWSKTSWVSNIFRAYEWVFGRGYGIRVESASNAGIIHGKVVVEYNFFTLEALLAHVEAVIRANIHYFFTALKSFLTLNFQPDIDYKPALITFGILGFIIHFETSTKYLPLFGLAIAFDAAYAGDTGSNAGSLTFSHTITGANPVLVAGGHTYAGGAGSTGDIITGCTYNAVAMTQVDKQLTTGGTYNRYQNLFIQTAPTAGANNVVLSASSSSFRLIVSSWSCSGAKQTGQPDASSKSTTTGSTSQALATAIVAANSWLVSSGVATDDTIAAGTGVTLRTGGNNFNTRIGDSNGPLATGSNSMTWTTTVNSAFNVIQVSIAPVPLTSNGAMLMSQA